MMQREQGGPQTVWPVMLTPFKEDGAVDYHSLRALIAWYEENGAGGLFAVCQSSEMFCLSLRERVDIAAFVKKHSRLPVIASGHVSFAPEEQLEELGRMADTGIDALVLITNRLAAEGEDDARWEESLQRLLARLPGKTPLGFYECPYPYKHLLTQRQLEVCAATGRFAFLKDTCCDIALIRRRLGVLAGSGMGLYNANTATLLESFRAGAAGFSGVMANFHPRLYAWLAGNWREKPAEAELVQSVLTTCAFIERQYYPVNAKHHLVRAGVLKSAYTRVKSHVALTPLMQGEVEQMDRMVAWVEGTLGI